MLTQYLGELSALGTALMFAFGSTLFTLSGRQIGSALVNRTRLLMAVIFVMGLHWLWYGSPLPLDAGAHPWFWLGISGFVGLALGDAFLFQAFVLVGPRISMLMMALAPVLSVIMAWLFLGETLDLKEILGILITMGGIAFVIAERQKAKNPTEASSMNNAHAHDNRRYLLGIAFGFGGALGQAGGLILSKIGLANDFPALSGNLIRITVALLAIWALSLVRGEIVSSYRTLKAHPNAVLMMLVAAFTGPVIGVWLSLIAVQHAPVGIASTLMSLTPIFLLPISYFVFKEAVSKQAIIGTIIAFTGTALLFL